MLDSLLPHAMEHSFRDFHAKGLDYLCLRRSEDLTLKVYFFDGDSSLTPEVVNPHDHRYDFTSRVLDGVVENVTYRHSVIPGVGLKYHAFSYLTCAKAAVEILRRRLDLLVSTSTITTSLSSRTSSQGWSGA